MDRQTLRKVRYYTRLHYPVSVTLTEDGVVGQHPDLPGCLYVSEDIEVLYAVLDRKRREWIADRVAQDLEVPLPNSHLLPKAAEPKGQPVAVRQNRQAQPAAAAAC